MGRAPRLNGTGWSVPGGSHVCWVVDDSTAYDDAAATMLAEGRAAGEKPVVFGPAGSRSLATLTPAAAVAADPRVAFLDGGPLVPDVMFAMFREQSALARAEGHERLRLVADMDWLLPGEPTTEATIGFELLLDRVVAELDATVVCAYRRSSYDDDAIAGQLCVHPEALGAGEEPLFRLVAGAGHTWRLSGEVDFAVAATFAAALAAAAGHGTCDVDVTGLDFVDVAGMRSIALAGRDGGATVRLHGAAPWLRRVWEAAGFHELAPDVELLAGR